jgi:predicted ABC-type transport system involved in lysophospholipase L1 biosynthesis ATPase subunit
MRCNLLKVVVDGKTLAIWALIGESGSGKSTLGMPPGLGGEGGGTQVFRWQATLG